MSVKIHELNMCSGVQKALRSSPMALHMSVKLFLGKNISTSSLFSHHSRTATCVLLSIRSEPLRNLGVRTSVVENNTPARAEFAVTVPLLEDGEKALGVPSLTLVGEIELSVSGSAARAASSTARADGDTFFITNDSTAEGKMFESLEAVAVGNEEVNLLIFLVGRWRDWILVAAFVTFLHPTLADGPDLTLRLVDPNDALAYFPCPSETNSCVLDAFVAVRRPESSFRFVRGFDRVNVEFVLGIAKTSDAGSAIVGSASESESKFVGQRFVEVFFVNLLHRC